MSALIVKRSHRVPVNVWLHQRNAPAADVYKLIASIARRADEMTSSVVYVRRDSAKRPLRFALATFPHSDLSLANGNLSMRIPTATLIRVKVIAE